MATIEETLKQYYARQAPATTTAAEPVRFKVGDRVSYTTFDSVYAEGIVRKAFDSCLVDVDWSTLSERLASLCDSKFLTLVASHEGEPTVPEWLREQLKALPAGATWRTNRGESKDYDCCNVFIALACGCERAWWVESDADEDDSCSTACTVMHAVAAALRSCGHAPTIVDGAAVLPVPETPFEPRHVVGVDTGGSGGTATVVMRSNPDGSMTVVDEVFVPEGHTLPTGAVVTRGGIVNDVFGVYVKPAKPRPYDEGGTNPIGLPVLPPPIILSPPRVHSIGDEAVREMMLGQPDRPQPGDVVSWEAYVGESDGKPVMAKHEGLVVKKAPAGPSWCLHARRKVDGKTVVTVVAVERCTVVRKRGSL